MVHGIPIAIASAGVQTITEHDPGGSLVAVALVVVLALVRASDAWTHADASGDGRATSQPRPEAGCFCL